MFSVFTMKAVRMHHRTQISANSDSGCCVLESFQISDMVFGASEKNMLREDCLFILRTPDSQHHIPFY